jgi:hypothetical protein
MTKKELLNFQRKELIEYQALITEYYQVQMQMGHIIKDYRTLEEVLQLADYSDLLATQLDQMKSDYCGYLKTQLEQIRIKAWILNVKLRKSLLLVGQGQALLFAFNYYLSNIGQGQALLFAFNYYLRETIYIGNVIL